MVSWNATRELYIVPKEPSLVYRHLLFHAYANELLLDMNWTGSSLYCFVIRNFEFSNFSSNLIWKSWKLTSCPTLLLQPQGYKCSKSKAYCALNVTWSQNKIESSKNILAAAIILRKSPYLNWQKLKDFHEMHLIHLCGIEVAQRRFLTLCETSGTHCFTVAP